MATATASRFDSLRRSKRNSTADSGHQPILKQHDDPQLGQLPTPPSSPLVRGLLRLGGGKKQRPQSADLSGTRADLQIVTDRLNDLRVPLSPAPSNRGGQRPVSAVYDAPSGLTLSPQGTFDMDMSAPPMQHRRSGTADFRSRSTADSTTSSIFSAMDSSSTRATSVLDSPISYKPQQGYSSVIMQDEELAGRVLSPQSTISELELGSPIALTPKGGNRRFSFGFSKRRLSTADSFTSTSSGLVRSPTSLSYAESYTESITSTPTTPNVASSAMARDRVLASLNAGVHTYDIPARQSTITSDEHPLTARRAAKGKARAESVDPMDSGSWTYEIPQRSSTIATDTFPLTAMQARHAQHRRRTTIDMAVEEDIAGEEDEMLASTPRTHAYPPLSPIRPSPLISNRQPTKKDNVLGVASTTLGIVCDISDGLNIPYVKGIAGLALIITDSLQQVSANKEACERLANHVCQVVHAIINQTHSNPNVSPELEHNIEHLMGTLRKIHAYITEQSKKSKISRFLRSTDDAGEVQQYSDELRHALDLFGLQATIRIQNQLHKTAKMAAELDDRIVKNMKRNHKMVMRALGGSKRASTSFNDTASVTTSNADTASIMTNDTADPPQRRPIDPPMPPPRPSIFYGRESELKEVLEAIVPPMSDTGGLPADAGRVAILGAPGVGKSSLALAALHDPRSKATFESRRYFIACDNAKTAPQLMSTIASFFELAASPQQGEANKLEHEIVEILSEHGARTLLVLDNFETPWETLEGRDEVEGLLSALAGIKTLSVIVTIRGAERPLGLCWARPCLPPLEPLSRAAALETYKAITDKNDPDPDLDRLMDLLENLPLAITLMANIAQYETTAALLRRWDGEFTTMLDRGAPHRLGSLDISIKISLASPRMLHVPYASALLALVCFVPDGLSKKSLDAITLALPEVGKAQMPLLQTALAFHDPAKRLKVLAPIRSYMQQNHMPPKEHIQVLEKHYMDLAARAATVGTAENSADLVHELSPEIGNIQTVLDRILENESGRRDAIQAAAHLAHFLKYTLSGSLRSLELAAEAAQKLGDDPLRAECVLHLARGAQDMGNTKQAVAQYKEALGLYEGTSDPRGQAECFKSLAVALVGTEDHARAAQMFEKARSLYESAGDLLGQGECWLHLASYALAQDELQTAQSRAEQAMRIFKKRGHAHWQARCLRMHGLILRAKGEGTAATVKFQQALQLFRKVGSNVGIAETLAEMALLAGARGDAATAFAHGQQAHELMRAGAGTRGSGAEAKALLTLAELAVKHGEADVARTQLESAATIFKQRGDLVGQVGCSVGFGTLSARQGDHLEAALHYDNAAGMMRKMNGGRISVLEAQALSALGSARAAAADGNPYAGLNQHILALAVFRKASGQANHLAGEIRWLGDFAQFEGKGHASLALYHAAVAVSRKSPDTRRTAGLHEAIGDACRYNNFRAGAEVRFARAETLFRNEKDEESALRCAGKREEAASI